MFGIWNKKKIGIGVMAIIAVTGLVLYYNFELKDQLLLGGLDPESYDAGCVILDISGDEITLAPQNYDADEPESYAEYVEQKELAESLRCFSLDIDTVINQNGERNSTERYEKISINEMRKTLDSGLPTAYIWYDEKGSIDVIMLYGETTREE